MPFARPISNQEGESLLRMVRHGKNVTNSRRAEVILASAQGMEVSENAANYHLDVRHVRLIMWIAIFSVARSVKATHPRPCGPPLHQAWRGGWG